MRPPVIENPKGATRLQRYSQRILTGFFWVLLVLLLRPLLTLLAWLVGGHLFIEVVSGRGGIWSLLKVPVAYILVVMLIAAVLIGWATYNQMRFRRNERRKHPPRPVSAQEMARFFGADESLVYRWQASRRIVMSHDEQGRPDEKGKTC